MDAAVQRREDYFTRELVDFLRTWSDTYSPGAVRVRPWNWEEWVQEKKRYRDEILLPLYEVVEDLLDVIGLHRLFLLGLLRDTPYYFCTGRAKLLLDDSDVLLSVCLYGLLPLMSCRGHRSSNSLRRSHVSFLIDTTSDVFPLLIYHLRHREDILYSVYTPVRSEPLNIPPHWPRIDMGMNDVLEETPNPDDVLRRRMHVSHQEVIPLILERDPETHHWDMVKWTPVIPVASDSWVSLCHVCPHLRTVEWADRIACVRIVHKSFNIPVLPILMYILPLTHVYFPRDPSPPPE